MKLSRRQREVRTVRMIGAAVLLVLIAARWQSGGSARVVPADFSSPCIRDLSATVTNGGCGTWQQQASGYKLARADECPRCERVLESAHPQPYTVFALYPGGEVRPFAQHGPPPAVKGIALN